MNILFKIDYKYNDGIIVLKDYNRYNNYDCITSEGIITISKEYLKKCKNSNINNDFISLLNKYNIKDYKINKRL